MNNSISNNIKNNYNYSKEELDDLVLNYLYQTNCLKTAELLEKQLGKKSDICYYTLIVNKIKENKLKEAIEIIQNNINSLLIKKLNNNLNDVSIIKNKAINTINIKLFLDLVVENKKKEAFDFLRSELSCNFFKEINKKEDLAYLSTLFSSFLANKNNNPIDIINNNTFLSNIYNLNQLSICIYNILTDNNSNNNNNTTTTTTTTMYNKYNKNNNLLCVLSMYDRFVNEFHSIYSDNDPNTSCSSLKHIEYNKLYSYNDIDYLIDNKSNSVAYIKKEDLKLSYLIENYEDEVWLIEFSSSNNLFCTVGRNCIVSVFYMSNSKEDAYNELIDSDSNKKHLTTENSHKFNSKNYIDYENNTDNIMKINRISNFTAGRKHITAVAFSLNDKYIALSSIDSLIKFYSIKGKHIKTFTFHSDIVSSIKFITDNLLISGGIDKKIILQNVNNINKHCIIEESCRIRDLLITNITNMNNNIYSDNYSYNISCFNNQNILIVIPSSMSEIKIYSYKIVNNDNMQLNLELKLIYSIKEQDQIISAAISTKINSNYMMYNTNKSTYNTSFNDKINSNYLLVNMSKVNASLNLYDLNNNYKLINKYYGHTQTQYTVKCAIAGTDNEYILCGSEDYKIYIWHRRSSIHLFAVKGHTGTINSVKMPFFGCIFSVSDDHTLRIWSEKTVHYTDNIINLNSRKRLDSYSSIISQGPLDEESNAFSMNNINQARSIELYSLISNSTYTISDNQVQGILRNVITESRQRINEEDSEDNYVINNIDIDENQYEESNENNDDEESIEHSENDDSGSDNI